MINRISWMIIGLAAAVAVVTVGMRFAEEPPKSGLLVPAEASGMRAVLAVPLPPADATRGDAEKRAAAITALANTPRAEAIPALGRILTDGEPETERPLALQALRDLALNQGDADGAIRQAVRRAIYHGDDFTKADDLQETLEIIEESLQHR